MQLIPLKAQRHRSMAHYRVEFSSEWIMGRWGFIDRMFHDMGGRPSDAARLENAWLVDFKLGPGALGKLLSERLHLKQADFFKFGVIFDILGACPPGQIHSGTPPSESTQQTHRYTERLKTA